MIQVQSVEQTTTLRERAQATRAAGAVIATLPRSTKDAALLALAWHLEAAAGRIAAANREDLAEAMRDGLADAKLRRLKLDAAGVAQIAAGLRAVAKLDDPVGRVAVQRTVPSGLRVSRIGCPIGVIAIIYEARPAVTIDAFALCFKAGNAAILKGGREAARTNAALATCVHEVLAAHDIPEAALLPIVTSDRDMLRELLAMDDEIDLVIPRGGAPLIQFVKDHSKIPTVEHFHGVCHTYVDADADLGAALEICVTGTTSAPATCNSLECVLVHADVARAFLPVLGERCEAAGVQVRGDAEVCALVPTAVAATDDDWGCEFLDTIIAVRVVDDMDAAIAHIAQYGSDHTDAIVTASPATAQRFTREVRSSCVLVNASTRFNDGFQLGLGAEIGISTSRVHAYGPMGLEELTVLRYVVEGDGHTR